MRNRVVFCICHWMAWWRAKGAMDIGFVHYNHELEDLANQVTATADTILWGRTTYEMMYI